MSRLFQYLHERRSTVKWVFYGSLVIIVGADFLVPRHEAHFFGDTVPAFWSIFGLILCWALIFAWKGLSAILLEKEEDYYDK